MGACALAIWGKFGVFVVFVVGGSKIMFLGVFESFRKIVVV